MKHGIVLAVFLTVPWLAVADQTGAFSDGKSLGSSVNQQNLNAINAGTIQDKIPAYGQSATEATYFQGGSGNTAGPGVAKVTTCSTAAPDSDAIKRQECDAVNFLASNPQIRPQFAITNSDPMVLGAKSARSNAEGVFETTGISGGTGSTTQCTTRTQTTPAQYTTETCSDLAAIDTSSCVTGRQINIDTDANFECQRTATTLSSATRAPTVTTPTCTYGRAINIDADTNFQCDETINGYETLTCKKTVQVEVEAVSGSAGRMVLGDFGSVYLFTGGGVTGVWLHTGTGAEIATSGNGTFSGGMLGIDSPGNAYKLDLSSNNCAGGTCTGFATLSLWRQFNSTWLGLSTANWSQSLVNVTQCSFLSSFGTGAGYRSGTCYISAGVCPNASDSATFSYSCSGSVPAGTVTLGAGQSATIEYVGYSYDVCDEYGGCYPVSYQADCNGSSWVKYNGNGSFTYSTYGRAGGSCGEAATISSTFGFPVVQKRKIFRTNNGCAGLEARAQ